MNYRNLSLSAMALALLVVSAPAFAAEDAAEATHDGKIVSITSSTLVMTLKGDKEEKEHSHTLAENAKVSLDGKACKPEELKAGMKIRVTTKKGEPEEALEIEAIDKNATFANTHDGEVVSVTKTRLVMTDKEGKKHSHAVSPDAVLTLDGKTCVLKDLTPGLKIRVTTTKTRPAKAVEIEAIDKNEDFA